MTNRSKPDVEAFAGIDVSAREISVARLRSKEENPKFATFANSPSRHKALLAFLLEGTDRIRVSLRIQWQLQPRLSVSLACSPSGGGQRHQSPSCSPLRGISRRA